MATDPPVTATAVTAAVGNLAVLCRPTVAPDRNENDRRTGRERGFDVTADAISWTKADAAFPSQAGIHIRVPPLRPILPVCLRNAARVPGSHVFSFLSFVLFFSSLFSIFLFSLALKQASGNRERAVLVAPQGGMVTGKVGLSAEVARGYAIWRDSFTVFSLFLGCTRWSFEIPFFGGVERGVPLKVRLTSGYR